MNETEKIIDEVEFNTTYELVEGISCVLSGAGAMLLAWPLMTIKVPLGIFGKVCKTLAVSGLSRQIADIAAEGTKTTFEQVRPFITAVNRSIKFDNKGNVVES